MAGRPRRGRRRLHHSPLFWFGAVLFLAAVTFYFLSDDLSLRPKESSQEDGQKQATGQSHDQRPDHTVDRTLMTQIGGAGAIRG